MTRFHEQPGPYYEPEEFGLGIVANLDAGDGYEFDMFVIWRDSRGQLYYQLDFGCSCDSPFAGYGLPDLQAGTIAEMHTALDEWAASVASVHYGNVTAQVADAHAELAKL
jgi:hypothetical protein